MSTCWLDIHLFVGVIGLIVVLMLRTSLLCLSAGPMFFLSCFSFVVGIAMLYYYRGESHKRIHFLRLICPLHSKDLSVYKSSQSPSFHIQNWLSTLFVFLISKPLSPYFLKDVLLPLFLPTEAETLRCTGPFLHCSAARLSKDVLISYTEVGKQWKWGRRGAQTLKNAPCEKNKQWNLPLCCAKLIHTLRALNFFSEM